MDEVRDIVSAAHSLRKANRLRVRLPLRSLVVVTDRDLEAFRGLIAAEVNVKDVRLESVESSGMTVTRELTVLPRELEPEQRKLTSKLFAAAARAHGRRRRTASCSASIRRCACAAANTP